MDILWVIKSFTISAVCVILMAVIMHLVKRACQKFLTGKKSSRE